METITVSSKGQIAIPKRIRESLGLATGTRLNLEIRGRELVLTKTADWHDMVGSIRGVNLVAALEEDRKLDRNLEDHRR